MDWALQLTWLGSRLRGNERIKAGSDVAVELAFDLFSFHAIEIRRN